MVNPSQVIIMSFKPERGGGSDSGSVNVRVVVTVRVMVMEALSAAKNPLQVISRGKPER